MNKYITILKKSAPALLSLFSSRYTLAQMFPYLPWMVHHIVPGLETKDIGYYSGIIACAQFVGRMLSSYLWGWLADRVGRKTVLTLSGILLAIATLGFGLSINMYMAVIFRFLIGLFNGIVPTAKAAASELSDDTTQPFISGVIGSVFSLGLVVGPVVSGFLADPIKQYALPPVWFFMEFPYVLPSVANAVVLLISVFVVYFFMDETLKYKKELLDSEINLIVGENEDCETNQGNSQKNIPETKVGKLKHALRSIRGSVLYELLTDRTVMLVLILNSIYSMVILTLDEVVPIWAEMPQNLGGLDMSIWNFSMIISICALIMLPFTIFTFQIMERYLGALKSYHILMALMIPVFVLLPTITVISNNLAEWICFGFLMFVARIFASGISAAFLMFINNSVTQDKLGAVNGLATSLCSFFRILSPLITCSIFSASLNIHFFPFDYHFVFILNGIILACSLFIGFALPKVLNQKKNNSTRPSETTDINSDE